MGGFLLEFVDPLCRVLVVWGEVGVEVFYSGCKPFEHIFEGWVASVCGEVRCRPPDEVKVVLIVL
jgi:hypothetical protein